MITVVTVQLVKVRGTLERERERERGWLSRVAQS
jgi:hypothetical protein